MMIAALGKRRDIELRRLSRYAQAIEKKYGPEMARSIKKAASKFINDNHKKKIAQQYQGDEADYNRMVASVQATVEKIAERLNSIGIPSSHWQQAADDIVRSSDLGKIIPDMPPIPPDLDDLKNDSEWYVDRLLQRYSGQWKTDENLNENQQAFKSVLDGYDQLIMPPAPQEDIDSGAYVPGGSHRK
jgi:hypothetical protein